MCRKLIHSVALVIALNLVLARPANAVTARGAWLFDEGSGTVINDATGLGSTGTLVGSAEWILGHMWMFSSSRQGGNKLLRIRLKTNDGQPTLEMKAGSFEVGEWIHGAIWWDGTNMKIYKNGAEVGTMAKGGTSVALDPAVQAAIGNQPIGAENRPFDGIIDDVRIYTRALTEAELAQAGCTDWLRSSGMQFRG